MDKKEKRELLIEFFLYFRDHGEEGIYDTVEEFVDRFLKQLAE